MRRSNLQIRRGDVVRKLAAFLTVFLPATLPAHHSIVGETTGDRFEVEGEIVSLLWGNPHPRFTLKVSTETGEELMHLSAPGLGSLERTGIREDTIKVGDLVKAWVRAPTRSTRYAVGNILAPDGTEIVFGRQSEPRWAQDGNYQRATPGSIPDDANVEASRAQAHGIFRVWSRVSSGPFRGEDLPLTDSARAALAVFDLEADYPIMRCAPPGMPRAMIGNAWPIEFIEHKSEILIRMEEFDIERTVHMDVEFAASNSPPTPLGYSVGRREGRTLIVETTQISWPYFDDRGIPLSESAAILERFILNPDETDLDYEITVTDPAVFTQPVTSSTAWTWLPGQVIKPYNCVPDQ